MQVRLAQRVEDPVAPRVGGKETRHPIGRRGGVNRLWMREGVPAYVSDRTSISLYSCSLDDSEGGTYDLCPPGQPVRDAHSGCQIVGVFSVSVCIFSCSCF